MRQNILKSQASLEERGWEPREERFLGQMEQARPWTEPLAPIGTCQSKPGDGLWLVWLRAILCTFYSHQWLDLYGSGAEDGLHALPVPQGFARDGLNQAAASHEIAASRSQHLMGQSGLLGPGSPPALPRSRTDFDISWRTPWPYLSLLLLVLLLLF